MLGVAKYRERMGALNVFLEGFKVMIGILGEGQGQDEGMLEKTRTTNHLRSWHSAVFRKVCSFLFVIVVSHPLAIAQTVPAFGRVEAIEALVAKRVEEILDVATRRPADGDAVFTWISQPGLIRTFGESPRFTQAFPLYSSPTEVFADGGQLEESIQSVAQWQEHPDRFTDLNEPINGRFPILDPRAASAHQVEGFRFEGDDDRLPMPVPWLYLLKDGTFVSSSEGSEENSIIARVAY